VLVVVLDGTCSEVDIGDLIGFAFFASAALTCAGVLRIGVLLEEELQLLLVSSFESSIPPPRPTDPGPFLLACGVFNLGGPLYDVGVEAADVVFLSYID
jgi:hypothetical protein